MTRRVLVLSSASVLLFTLVLTASLRLANRSPFCPLIEWDTVCTILDKQNERTLVQYFEADINTVELVVFEGKTKVGVVWPIGKVRRFENVLKENVITLDPRDETVIIVNGEKVGIEKTP